MTTLVVDTINSEKGLLALEQDWRQLEERTHNTLPFRTFTWTATWWRHLREDRSAVRDSLALRAVRTPDGRLVAVAPFIVTQRPGVGPLRVRCLQLIGADPNVTELRGALCDPAFARASYEAILADVTRGSHGLDWIRWTGIEEAGREGLGSTAARWSDGVVTSVLRLPATWEELRSSRPRNLREALRRAYNALKRDGLAHAFEIATQPGDVEGGLADFYRLHSARSKVSGTIDHKDVFADSSSRSFLREVCDRFAADGILRIFRLRVAGKVVATRIGFVLHDSLYLYYSGFDPEYAQYAVMTTTAAEAMKYAIGTGLRSVNLSTGRDVWKQRWRPEETLYREALIFPAHTLGRAKYQAMTFARRAFDQTAMQRWLARRAPGATPG